jgi:signal transduction histidine kinase
VRRRTAQGSGRLRLARARPGVQAEVVLSLLLVMLAATAILAVALFHWNESRWRELLGRALRAEAYALPAGEGLVPDTVWWQIRPGGTARPMGGAREAPDAETLALARAVQERGAPLLRPGAPWEPIRFAAPLGPGGVVVARLPGAASLRLRVLPLVLVAALLAVDVAVFTAFGASMLRRRVVLPLRRLSAAANALADGSLDTRVAVEGPRETVELAGAFNEMGEALARRTRALEKAVVELREANGALRQARAGLDRAERLAAVGRLAAGVAHEVGNPMGALVAFVDLARRDPGLSAESRGHLVRASEQVERVRRIVRGLLEFSRPGQGATRAPVDLAAAVQEAVTLVRAQVRYRSVQFEVTASDATPAAVGDPGAIGQILLNLILNAADAVLAVGGGRVALRVRPAPLARRVGDLGEEAAGRRAPDAVECEVADDGCGIEEEDRERIFDPFFTSKPPGEGTGLGLSNSLRLAEEMSGRLGLEAPPSGFRTAFVLRLPTAPGPAGSATGCEVRSSVRGEGSRTELVADEKS